VAVEPNAQILQDATALYFPQIRTLAVAFYSERLTPEERQKVVSSRLITTPAGSKVPVATAFVTLSGGPDLAVEAVATLEVRVSAQADKGLTFGGKKEGVFKRRRAELIDPNAFRISGSVAEGSTSFSMSISDVGGATWPSVLVRGEIPLTVLK
jgi:hypothetical protein